MKKAFPPKPFHERPIATLKGVGPSIAAKLEKLGMKTAFDLLLHLPLRWQDRTRITPIGALQPGDSCVVQGEILHTEITIRKRRMLLVQISDGTGMRLMLRYFRFSKAQQENLPKGKVIRVFGEVRRSAVGFEMIHPEVRSVNSEQPAALEESLTPVYPATEGLSQNKLRSLIVGLLDELQQQPALLQDPLPVEVRKQAPPCSLVDALLNLHRPPPDVSQRRLLEGDTAWQQRLAFDELLAHAVSMQQRRAATRSQLGLALKLDEAVKVKFLAGLGFELTNAQNKVVAAIEKDLQQEQPAMRLVQGDVGSGKTVVAALAALQAIANGEQALMMAPTELLAEQHWLNFQKWFSPLGIEPVLLRGRSKKADREAAFSAPMVIGTHALFQADMQFEKPAVAIIDEQHRFGVHQRLALRDKRSDGRMPHQIIMTATPIPRTLAMTGYADLDYSVIDELPPGRQPIKTVVMSNERRPELAERIGAACAAGEQAYWVCTLVEESEALQAEAAEDTAEWLAEHLPNVRVGLVHGRLKADQKEMVMKAFKNAELDLLVATTVVEVGVDVPNASLMIIENAERLGLAQLHQLRGRVGRGSRQSHCVLTYQPPLSENAKTRLNTMRDTTDGFKIAEADLKIRGPGELMGTKQSGELNYKVADLERDRHWLPVVKDLALELLHQQPDAAANLVVRWMGSKTQYADVG
ncbi:MAG: ATP-dependent DNA helicase RecG [Gammaproteobacteria bacterium]|nr:ATP-dependent DNA helicase RecG [Gammaproteobacteria bacterium]